MDPMFRHKQVLSQNHEQAEHTLLAWPALHVPLLFQKDWLKLQGDLEQRCRCT